MIKGDRPKPKRSTMNLIQSSSTGGVVDDSSADRSCSGSRQSSQDDADSTLGVKQSPSGKTLVQFISQW